MPWRVKMYRKPDHKTTASRGYDHRHRVLSEQLRREFPICQYQFPCCMGLSEDLDHNDGDTSNNELDNLVATCKACHRFKTANSKRKYGHG